MRDLYQGHQVEEVDELLGLEAHGVFGTRRRRIVRHKAEHAAGEDRAIVCHFEKLQQRQLKSVTA